ncbi:MAG: BspA family leucine-rich repeat surface protein [Lachnospiraceae bacterium]|nr:BspA family leucine-rich repeat surface protein [Lachnospiraceae bacterium]
MKTKRIQSFLFAIIFVFESIVAGMIPVGAQEVSENAVSEADTGSEVALSETVSGNDGALYWEIDTDGHLTISGNGDYVKRNSSSTTGWLYHAEEIKTATVNVTGMKDASYMFLNCKNMESVDLSGFDTSSVTSMEYMFGNCCALTAISLNGCNTSSVTNMSCMFSGCFRLASVEMNEIDTSSVANMSMMFFGCRDLTDLNLNKLNTRNVTNMMGMFFGCSGLTSLDISGFDMTNVSAGGTETMFYSCDNLATIEAPEKGPSADMILPATSEDYVWKYQPTGEIVTVVTDAGIYTREIKSEETPELPGTSDGNEPVTDNSDTSVKEEPKAKVEIKSVTNSDGSVTTTKKITEPSGEVTLEIVSTSKDRKVETVVNMKIDASGRLQDASIEVIHVIKSTKLTVNLNELKALADQITLCNTECVYPVGSRSYVSENVDSLGDIYEKEQETVGVAQKKANVSIKVTAKSPSGQKKYSVAIKKTDLTKKKLVVYASDKKGNAVMVNNKKNKATVNKKNDLTLKITKKGDYQVQNTKDAKKTDKKIMKTVKPKKSNVTVKKGKSSSVKLSSKCNKANISKITYASNNSNVKVSKKGKITAKGSGSAKITATVTMKNGKKKKIKVNVKVA